MSKWVERALKIAARSTHKRHALGCLVMRGGSVVAQAANLGTRGRCSERRALKRQIDPDHYRGCSLLVVRSNLGCSKPCPKCMEAIASAGISNLYYYNAKGELEHQRV